MLIIKKIESLSDVARAFILMELMASLSWNIIVPVIMKLQGQLWTAGIIAGYYIAKQVGQLVVPYLEEKYKLGALYRATVMLDALYLASVGVYFINVDAFLVIEASLMVAYGTIMGASEIKFNGFLMVEYSHKEYENTAAVERPISAVAATVGYVVVIILDALMPIEYYMGVIAIMLAINLIARFRYYAKYWR